MILVTGATGKVGGQVAAQLAEAGTRVPASASCAATRLPDGVEPVRGDLADPASLAAAVTAKVDGVFLMWPLPHARGAAETVTLLAEHARRLVYLSARGVPEAGEAGKSAGEAAKTGEAAEEREADILGTHARLERLVRGSGAEWTLLRPGGFASNTLGWAAHVRAGGPVRTASPQAGRALVHEADIAALAVRALLTDELVATAPEITGPDVLTQAEQVATLREVLGRPLTVERVSRAESRTELIGAGVPPVYADAILDAHAAMETTPETVAPDTARLLGRPPLTYRQWVADHAADFG
ncbi:NAD-dependent epimerase/dehydratase family protein [Streptomyces diacarni]|uniref:NAD-dependent epimerase/dehydratase family protein n=1 Tax=Streptomyces diacarni TaxID=2800381 RepID=A0A367EUF1_9ACTN|nr:NAD(P)H-binding protein [Streptomyces diacarni]RCG21235.1 NAD-dependent epimerase/dehydratase family protein [Streptomyces diacarni]